jgi:hypothetical protein
MERLPQLVSVNAEYRIKRYIPAYQGPGPVVSETAAPLKRRYITEYLAATVVNTSMNNMGISSSDVCAYGELPNNRIGVDPEGIIVCKSGKSFRNVMSEKGSSTGTPSYLYYDNYIGQRIIPGKSSIPGASKRITYCAGSCSKTSH